MRSVWYGPDHQRSETEGPKRTVRAMHAAVLTLHVAAGAAGLLLGPLVLRAEHDPPRRSRTGGAFLAAVAAVAVTAAGLVAFDPPALWWLLPLAALAAGLALLGATVGREHHRLYAHGQGGAYISLVTAFLVVSLPGPAAAAAWILPTLARRAADRAPRPPSRPLTPSGTLAPHPEGRQHARGVHRRRHLHDQDGRLRRRRPRGLRRPAADDGAASAAGLRRAGHGAGLERRGLDARGGARGGRRADRAGRAHRTGRRVLADRRGR